MHQDFNKPKEIPVHQHPSPKPGPWRIVTDGDSLPMLQNSMKGAFRLFHIQQMISGRWEATQDSMALQEHVANILTAHALDGVILPPKVPVVPIARNGEIPAYVDLRTAYDKLYAVAEILDYQRQQMDARYREQEETVKTLRSQLITGFWEDEVPQFTQGEPTHEITSLTTADELNSMAKRMSEIMKDRDNIAIQRDALQRGSNPNTAEAILNAHHQPIPSTVEPLIHHPDVLFMNVSRGGVTEAVPVVPVSKYLALMHHNSTLKDKTIRELQSSLPWTVHYHRDFRNSPMAHKDFGHALLHIYKAAGKLAIVVNDAEHGGSKFLPADVDRFVADMVVCALRMANTCPGRHIDLQHEVESRIDDVNSRPPRKPQ